MEEGKAGKFLKTCCRYEKVRILCCIITEQKRYGKIKAFRFLLNASILMFLKFPKSNPRTVILQQESPSDSKIL